MPFPERNKMNALKKTALRASGVAALALVSASSAMAQTAGADAGIDAINELGAKGTAYIAAAFTVAVLVAGGFWGIRMMKKAFGAAK
jgi:succinate dehydrogenase/fumarate reductase cytochrome b subunit